MVVSETFNRFFDFLPSLDWGKFWSFLKVNRPTRPVSTLKHTSPIAWVMVSEISRSALGFVYLSEDRERLIYAAYDDDEGPFSHLTLEGYINRTPKDFLENTPPVYKDGRKRDGIVLEQNIGAVTTGVSAEDSAWVKRCFDPENKVTFKQALTLG